MSIIVIMPGGFHPFHAGHFALYQSAKKAFPEAEVYVAATNDQSERPFPFSLKEKLAKLAGVEAGHFVQVKSPFQSKEIMQHYNPDEDILIFVRSEKDRNESPKPGGTKKDGSPAYFQPWTGKDVQPFGKHAYFAYLPTVEFGPGITSATQIRNAWPALNDKRKTAMVMSLYPATQKNPKLAQTVVSMFDQVMGEQEDVADGFNKNLKEGARPIGGLMTDPQARTIKDPATGGLIPADDFFAKYPDKNKQAWETALAAMLDPAKAKAAAAATTAAYNKEFNDVSWMTPEEQAQYKQLQVKDSAATQAGTRTYGAERFLKRLFQQKMDAKKAASMLKVHWAPLKQLESFLQGKVNNKVELSAYLAPNIESIGKTRWGSNTVGIVLDGHITIGGRGDLGSDQYKMTAGQRGQQKYVSRPGQIDPTLSMDTSVHHEVLIDNWRVKEIVLPADIPQEVDNLVQQYKIPVRRLGNMQGVAEGAPIVVMPAPIDVRNPKKSPQPQRYMGDIVPPTKPLSTEKRGVKGRPGQRPMPNYEVDEGAEEALHYATQAHAGQTRSGGDPYITHPVRVADHIKQYKQSHNLDALISAAYLHDTVEDTDTTHEALHDLFGGLVASLVKELTSDPEQIKQMGKAQYLAHKMAAMSSYALVIKLADRLDNVKDITTARTPEWRAKYANETNHILNYIEKTRALSGTHKKLIELIRAKLAEINNSQQDVAEAVEEEPGPQHRIAVKITDPNTYDDVQKIVRVDANSKQDALDQAEEYFAKRGIYIVSIKYIGMVGQQSMAEEWSQKYKKSINCSHPKGFSQKAHCAGKKKHNESIEMEMICPDCGMCQTHGDHSRDNLEEACWKGYHKEGNKKLFGKTVPNCVKNEDVVEEKCPHCNGPMFSEMIMNEKKDACYYKVKSRYKVWPSAYASGALVKCRNKGASNWGNSTKNESSILAGIDQVDENLHQWFKEKWVRFGPDGKIRGDCARGDDSEGKPKCLPQSKAQNLGKKARASAAARKRREDPNPERSGKAINVNTKKKSSESVAEGSERNDDLVSTLNSFGYYSDDSNVYVNEKTGDKIARIGSNWKHQSGQRGNGADELGNFLSTTQADESSVTKNSDYIDEK